MPQPPPVLPKAPEKPATLLITIGSTLFPSLTSFVLSSTFLTALPDLGVQRLVVQYGKADISIPDGATPHLLPNGRRSFEYPGRSEKSQANTGVGEGRGVEVEMLEYTDDFEGLIKEATWVISHAGAGSILTILRVPRPLLVIPNTDLMDNHQAELADALGHTPAGEDDESGKNGGYLLVSTLEDLMVTLPKLLDLNYRPKAFPPTDSSKFRSILNETAGYGL